MPSYLPLGKMAVPRAPRQRTFGSEDCASNSRVVAVGDMIVRDNDRRGLDFGADRRRLGASAAETTA